MLLAPYLMDPNPCSGNHTQTNHARTPSLCLFDRQKQTGFAADWTPRLYRRCPGVRKTNIYGKWVKESLENLQIVFKLLQSSFPVYFTGHSLFLYMVSTVSISLCILVLAKVLLRDRLRSTSGHCWPTSGEQRMLQSTNRQTTMCQCQHIPAMKPIHTVMPTPVLIA